MEKPTPSTLLVLGVLAFPTVAFPALFVPVLAAWIGWKIYRRRVPHHSREIRQSIREREARQRSFPYRGATVQIEASEQAASDPELEAAIEQFMAAARRMEAHQARRRVPRDRP